MLATGLRKFQEMEVVKDRWAVEHVLSYDKLAEQFGITKHTLQECCKMGSWQKGKFAQGPPQAGQ